MKKIIAICLLIVMALGLCACGDKNVEARFVGTWQSADGTATLTLNADGTADFVDTEGDNAGEYNFLWVAESNSSIIIKWDGEPIPASKDQETIEETQPDTETAEVVEDTEGTEGADATGETTSTRRDDPSIVGYGSMTVTGGEMVLFMFEGSSTDALLFVYNSTNKQQLIKIS